MVCWQGVLIGWVGRECCVSTVSKVSIIRSSISSPVPSLLCWLGDLTESYVEGCLEGVLRRYLNGVLTGWGDRVYCVSTVFKVSIIRSSISSPVPSLLCWLSDLTGSYVEGVLTGCIDRVVDRECCVSTVSKVSIIRSSISSPVP